MNSKIANTLRSGFTIVELIVVIVVIAVLASITLVSYNYLQTRAANTATAANVKQYVDALDMYAFEHGRYPAVNSCLGEKPKNTESCGSYQYENCGDFGILDSTIDGEYKWDSVFNAKITKYMGDQPNKVQPGSIKSVTPLGENCVVTETATSPVYHWANYIIMYLDGPVYSTSKGGAEKAYYISYPIDKNGECPISDSIRVKSIFNPDSVSCMAYGGDVELKNEYIIGG